MYKDKKVVAPGNRTLMPIVSLIMQKFGGKASKNQVVFAVMSYCNLPHELYEKALNETGWAASYLRKIGFMKSETKRGEWELKEEYMNMSFEELKKQSYRLYDDRLGR